MKTVANTIGAANPRLLDAEVLAELVLPRVFDKVVQNYCKDEDGLHEFAKDHSIVLTDGIGTLPDGVKTEYIDSIYLPSNPMASYIPRYEDFYLNNSEIVDTFTIQNGQFYFRGVGEDSGDSDETISINCITIPSFPSLSSDTVDIKASIIEQIIGYAAAVLVGNVPLSELGLEYMGANGG